MDNQAKKLQFEFRYALEKEACERNAQVLFKKSYEELTSDEKIDLWDIIQEK